MRSRKTTPIQSTKQTNTQPDAWNGGCFAGSNHPNCPNPEGPDYAFGQAPMLVTACRANKGCKQLAVVGQKSGIVWAIRLDSGAIDWWTQVGPGVSFVFVV